MNARTMLDGQFLEGVCEDRQRIVIVKMELTVFFFFSERGTRVTFPVPHKSHQTHFAMFLCTKAVPGNAVVASDSCTLESEHPSQRIYRTQWGEESVSRRDHEEMKL